MNYAIYKQTGDSKAYIVHSFFPQSFQHRAKAAAVQKLDDMWRTILRKPNLYKNASGSKNEISYDYMTSVNTTERIRFYIAKM